MDWDGTKQRGWVKKLRSGFKPFVEVVEKMIFFVFGRKWPKNTISFAAETETKRKKTTLDGRKRKIKRKKIAEQ